MKIFHLKAILVPLIVTLALVSTSVYGQDDDDMDDGVDRNGQPTENIGTPEQALDKMTTSLTDKAQKDLTEPYLGERAKIQEIIDVIKSKKSVYLVSDAGAGKTATIEQVARVLFESKSDLEILTFNSTNLEAGTKYRGTLEERLQLLLKALEDSKGKKILFMDEFHLMMAIPKFMDTLKPMMARGEITIIGATTEDEYKRDVESDRAMVRRGQMVRLLAPTPEKVLTILRAVREDYERKYSFPISDAALTRITQMVFKIFSTDAPIDQSFKILNRAASLLRNEKLGASSAKFNALDKVEALGLQLKSLKRDLSLGIVDDDVIKQEIKKVEDEIEDAQKEISKLDKIVDLQQRLNTIRSNLNSITDLAEKSRVQYQDIPMIEAELASLGVKPGVRTDFLSDIHINLAIGEMSGLSQEFMSESTEERVAKFPARMKSEVKGQDPAIDFLARKMKTIAAEVSDRKAPVLVFIAGSTGVGKTFISEKVAQFRHGSEKNMTKLNGGAMKTRESVWGLFGPERGYEGAKEGGKFTEPLRSKPNQLVLFDEYGKANREIDDALLPVMEKGVTQDSYGRTVDASQATIIFTDNVGADYALDRKHMKKTELAVKYGYSANHFENMTQGEMDDAIMRDLMMKVGFRPEWINRLDAVLVAESLGYKEMLNIVKSKLEKAKNTLRALKGIELKYDRSIVFAIARAGYDEQFGARPLGRALETHVTDRIADMVLDHKARAGDVVAMKFIRTQPTAGTVVTELVGKAKIETPLKFRTQIEIDNDLITARNEEAELDNLARLAAPAKPAAKRVKASPATCKSIIGAKPAAYRKK